MYSQKHTERLYAALGVLALVFIAVTVTLAPQVKSMKLGSAQIP